MSGVGISHDLVDCGWCWLWLGWCFGWCWVWNESGVEKSCSVRFSSRESNLGEKINSGSALNFSKNCDIIDDSWALNSGAVDVSLWVVGKERAWLWLAGDRARRAEASKDVDAKVGLERVGIEDMTGWLVSGGGLETGKWLELRWFNSGGTVDGADGDGGKRALTDAAWGPFSSSESRFDAGMSIGMFENAVSKSMLKSKSVYDCGRTNFLAAADEWWLLWLLFMVDM